jgi:hypothetical protein
MDTQGAGQDDHGGPIAKAGGCFPAGVESLMFTIKDGFEFGELGRRGLDAVRDELLEKVLAYKSCRIILRRERRREELEKAA